MRGTLPTVVPVNLGCCPSEPRCVLCNPAPVAPGPETVAALVELYAAEADGDVLVRFFGGPPPGDALLDAIGGRAFDVRVRPDLLTRADAERLRRAGCVGFELDALSFDDLAVRAIRRRHRRALVLEQAATLRDAGTRVGVVLAIGLPGTSLESALVDADLVVGRFDTARLHPVLVLDRSGLRRWTLEGRYQPLQLGEAVTAARAVADRLEGGGVQVIRIGQQPGPDELGGKAVAGPVHASLRELVEARRALDRLHALCGDLPPGSRVAIRCAPADESRVRGPLNQHVRDLRAAHRLVEVDVRPDPGLPRGEFHLEVA